LLVSLLAICVLAAPALGAPGLKAGALNEFQVELNDDLRRIAGRGQLAAVSAARVTVAVPPGFDPDRSWPVMIVSATSDQGYQSSRSLLAEYAAAGMEAGWILIASDPAPLVGKDQDGVPLRYALSLAALGALATQWKGAESAPLAFGGFSGGSKYSGWLAATFASRGRRIAGIYVAGINEDTVLSGAKDLGVLDDAYRRTPVFLQSGEQDVISTPGDHQRIRDELRRAGFKNVRIEYFSGPHVTAPALLGKALAWFSELGTEGAPGQPPNRQVP
jgi:hypothetical protein